MNQTQQWLFVGLAVWVGAASAHAATTIFSDPITNYTLGSQYVADNPAVFKSQDNGGNIAVVTNLGVWAAAPGDEFVNIGSGGLGNYTTLAVSNNVTDRYGQIFVRVGKNPINTSWMRLVMDANSSPILPGYPTPDNVVAGAGADVIWDPNGLFRYYSGASESITSPYPTAQMHNLTINYDLQNATYDVWVNTNLLVSGASFETAGFGSTVRSIALGGAYWSGDGVGAVLDQWYWRSDAQTAFTTFGQPLPEPTTIGLVGIGLGLCGLRRRN